MPRTCTICGHPQRAAIEHDLASGQALRAIAARYGTTATTLSRHRDGCLAGAIAAAKAASAVATGTTILEQVRDLQRETIEILRGAKHEKRYTSAVLAISAALKNLELQARLTGELDERPQINILVQPEWLFLRDRILGALAPHPLALEAVIDAIGEPGC